MFDPGGAPGLVMGPCIVEIYCIVIRNVQYQLEFQGSTARNRTDGQTAEITTISPRFSKSRMKNRKRSSIVVVVSTRLSLSLQGDGGENVSHYVRMSDTSRQNNLTLQ
ncbi:hypothetical protein DPMN_030503 [Dreissena polymorpha]|uniref:Uncharacterized protein n=1 Tax=Dreissena polymorpha TaxID=45954 RepID=A0A9D4RI56_DREPO|nr:hypothetical protein DPMN_030503 [Dreissena polymorpha]